MTSGMVAGLLRIIPSASAWSEGARDEPQHGRGATRNHGISLSMVRRGIESGISRSIMPGLLGKVASAHGVSLGMLRTSMQ